MFKIIHKISSLWSVIGVNIVHIRCVCVSNNVLSRYAFLNAFLSCMCFIQGHKCYLCYCVKTQLVNFSSHVAIVGKKHSHACFSLVMFHAKVMSLMFSYMTLFISMSTSYSSNILLSGFSSSSWVNFFYSSDRYNLPVPFTYMIMIRESFFYYLFFSPIGILEIWRNMYHLGTYICSTYVKN